MGSLGMFDVLSLYSMCYLLMEDIRDKSALGADALKLIPTKFGRGFPGAALGE